MKLKAIIPGAVKGIHKYLNSKFSAIYSDTEYDIDEDGIPRPKIIGRKIPIIASLREKYPDKYKKYSSSMLKSYFVSETKCKFEGHVPRPSGRKNHCPTCANCYQMLPEYGAGFGWTPELEKEKYGSNVREYCKKPGCKGYYGGLGGICIGGSCTWKRNSW